MRAVVAEELEVVVVVGEAQPLLGQGRADAARRSPIAAQPAPVAEISAGVAKACETSATSACSLDHAARMVEQIEAGARRQLQGRGSMSVCAIRAVRSRPPGPAGQQWGDRLAGIGATLAKQGCASPTTTTTFEFLRYDGRMAIEWLFDFRTPSRSSVGRPISLGCGAPARSRMRWVRRTDGWGGHVRTSPRTVRAAERTDGVRWAWHRRLGHVAAALRGHCERHLEHDNPSEYRKTLQVSLRLMRATLS